MAHVRWDLLGPDSRLVIQLDRSQQILDALASRASPWPARLRPEKTKDQWRKN